MAFIIILLLLDGKISSFQRQLNLYEFRRQQSSNKIAGSYYHSRFARNRPDLLHSIQRVTCKEDKSNKKNKASNSNDSNKVSNGNNNSNNKREGSPPSDENDTQGTIKRQNSNDQQQMITNDGNSSNANSFPSYSYDSNDNNNGQSTKSLDSVDMALLKNLFADDVLEMVTSHVHNERHISKSYDQFTTSSDMGLPNNNSSSYNNNSSSLSNNNVINDYMKNSNIEMSLSSSSKSYNYENLYESMSLLDNNMNNRSHDGLFAYGRSQSGDETNNNNTIDNNNS